MSAAGDTMLAAVYHGQRDVRLEHVPVPAGPRPGELLLEVRTVGVCGTDAAEWAEGAAQIPVGRAHRVTGHHGPLVIGHEFSATVTGVAPGVSADWLGALVACCGAVTCGRCAACAAGRGNQCASYSVVGLHRDGALTRYVSAPVASCLRVDGTGLSADEAALGQPMAIAVHAARRGGARDGDRAVVLGTGGIGAFIAYVLAQWGVDVTAVDLDERRLAVARGLGAVRTVLGGTGDDVAAISAAAAGPDVIFEVTGTRPVLQHALALAPVGGRIVLVGMQKQPAELVLQAVTIREQQLTGTNSLDPRTDFPDAIELLARRQGHWDLVAPTVLPLAELVTGALEPLAAGRSPAIKILVDPVAAQPRGACTGSPAGVTA
ncbi:MAG: zinc-dependent alcohol dehydrogenase [Streptosporangiaceae bacterium]